MKKLLSIVASALALGAFADAGNTPMTFELPEGLPAGAAVSLVCDGDVVHTMTPTSSSITYSTENLAAGEYWLEYNGEQITESLTIGTSASAPQFASARFAADGDTVVCKNTLVDTDFTTATALPKGWTAKRNNNVSTTAFNFSATNGAVVKDNWGSNLLYTSCSITSDTVATVDVTTFCQNNNSNVVLFFGSSTYSVFLGNSYDNDMYIAIGSINDDATTKFPCFQSGTGANPVDGTKQVIAESGALKVNAPLTYHLVIGNGKLTGTITDSEGASATIEYTLPETYAFTTFGMSVASAGGNCGVKSVTIKDDQEPPTTREITVTNSYDTFTYEGESTTLQDGDIVIIPSEATVDAWHGQDGADKLAGHAVVVGKRMNWKWSITKMTANNEVFFYGSLTDATIDGSGKFFAEETHTVNGACTITATIGQENGGHFVLADGATLTVAAKLDDGMVTTDVENKAVVFNDSTKTYSLIQQYTMTIREIEHTTRYYLAAKDQPGTSADKIAVDGTTVKINSGSGFTAYYVADEGYTLSTTANVSVNAEKTMAWYFFSNVYQDWNYDPQITVTPVVPEAPTATVTTTTATDLDAAYTFTANAEEAEATSTYYADWRADFEVTFDGAIAKDTVKLAGKYTVPSEMQGQVGYDGSWVGFTLDAYETTDDPIKLVGQFGLDLTYATVRQIGTFGCGVKNLAVANGGKTMTVKLVLTNPETEESITISTTEYTLVAPKVPENIPAAQQSAYDAWAAKHEVTGQTSAALTAAFAMDVAPAEAEKAVEDAIKLIDLASLSGEGGVEAAVAAIKAKYPNADVSMKDVTSDITGAVSETTHLYKLVIELKK